MVKRIKNSILSKIYMIVLHSMFDNASELELTGKQKSHILGLMYKCNKED